jgi:hypothetical protein
MTRASPREPSALWAPAWEAQAISDTGASRCDGKDARLLIDPLIGQVALNVSGR